MEVRQDFFRSPDEYALAHYVARDLRMSRAIAQVSRQKFNMIDLLEQQEPTVSKTLHLERNDRHLFYLVNKEFSHWKRDYRAIWDSLSNLWNHLYALTSLS